MSAKQIKITNIFLIVSPRNSLLGVPYIFNYITPKIKVNRTAKYSIHPEKHKNSIDNKTLVCYNNITTTNGENTDEREQT